MQEDCLADTLVRSDWSIQDEDSHWSEVMMRMDLFWKQKSRRVEINWADTSMLDRVCNLKREQQPH